MERFADKPRDWQPLVYCWRGGQRSRALAHVLNEVGWRAMQLDGGYRAYRRHVVGQLETLPSRFRFVVLCGLTGSGKSRLLAALAAAGAQTLDLEAIARHRGSLLGEFPGVAQPSQKAFETAIAAALGALDPARVVFVESESKRDRQAAAARDAARAHASRQAASRSSTALAQRVALIKDEYGLPIDDPAVLAQRLQPLAAAGRQDSAASAGRRWPRNRTGTRSSANCSAIITIRFTPVRCSGTFPPAAPAAGEAIEVARRVRRGASLRWRASVLAMTEARPLRWWSDAVNDSDVRREFAFRIVNVFAEERLAGNPLAVFENATRTLRRGHAGARAAVQSVGDDVHPAVANRRRAGADFHADLRDAFRRASDAGKRARRARACRRGRRAGAGDARRDDIP